MCCGERATEEKGKNLLRAPTFDGPSMATCEISSQSSPSSTFGPTTQNGPILQEEASVAPGSTTAVGWTVIYAMRLCVPISFPLLPTNARIGLPLTLHD